MKRILLCTDGSSYGQVACEYAAWFSRGTPCSVRALYVTDLRQFEIPVIADLGGSMGLQPYHDVIGKLQELERLKAHAILADAERCLRDAGFVGQIESAHATGFLVDQLAEFERHAELVLLGKRGQNANFATGHLGSTMERVLRATIKPCFLSSRSFRAPSRVLLAYDGSPSSRRALEQLVSDPVARGWEVHVIIVAQRNAEEAALAHLRAAETALVTAGFQPTCQMLHGAVEDEVGAYVETRSIDCLWMGAHGHGRIRQLVIGSTTTALIRQCRIPAMVFR